MIHIITCQATFQIFLTFNLLLSFSLIPKKQYSSIFLRGAITLFSLSFGKTKID